MDITKEVLDKGCKWLRDYVTESGKKHLIIGVSGGVDSAVVASWAAMADCADLILVRMPYLGTKVHKVAGNGDILPAGNFPDASLGESLEHAELLINGLRMKDHSITTMTTPIDHSVVGMLKDLDYDNHPHAPVALGNLKARMRAVALRTLSNVYNGLILGTENLTEHEMGYFTIGGDEESDLEMLSYFSKREVRELARLLGVPEIIITKPSTADLFVGQTDEGEMGFSYDDADRVVEALRDSANVFDPAAFNPLVLQRKATTEFKRQAKPTFNVFTRECCSKPYCRCTPQSCDCDDPIEDAGA